ncbi:MATH domain and coiled-coil domain-containing protein At3g58440-like isoform X2 [Daucus carota subsp. sativus]|uniref:MATH domain and coiled-coil domain-containing protein At3g58440-like isoform X2 n=1 Tax=Daucus carota subsp. sativus TaxID=79200 RepID=UPI0007EFD7FA|nr:PREDICTED: MATH domain and coiled-coil domain-containing protein At3g58440-like isoform X2 [Daucus carota subsp. sativus]
MALVSAEDDQGAVLRESRDTPPAHYVLKLKNFSAFSQNGVDQITSNTFQVGDLHWKIKLFLKGSNGGKDDYVSMYLMLDASKGVKAFFKFFLLDQSRGNYLVVQGKASRFDSFKCEWGLDKFISLKDFEEPTNGYLVNDTSFFGVEVFICEGLPLGECYSISSKVANISSKYKWVVTEFSGLKEPQYSDEFVVGGYKWKLWLHPEGNRKYKGYSLSIYLVYVDSKSSTTEHEVKAEFELTLKDQSKQNHKKKKSTTWFGASTPDWGFSSFIELTDLKDDKKGYLVADQCTIEAEVTVLCEGSCKTLKC